MRELKEQDIRFFRLHTHHLSSRLDNVKTPALAGACGMQNTPPGAWETALFNRVSNPSLSEMEACLYSEKSLLQAWSFRGAPVVFPANTASTFLSALVPEEGEEWIYTHGILAALDHLQMSFDDLLKGLLQVMPGLDDTIIFSKSMLDQTLAEWMLPLLPAAKRDLWNAPSLYGRPDIQTVGGAVVSFLLRPCSFLGLVVFGERVGASPTFTSLKKWLGKPLKIDKNAGENLVRKYLHCYGPANVATFMQWLGCSKKQAQRLWNTLLDEMEPVEVLGKKAFILSEDKETLFAPPAPQRELLLLGAHDPYLDQRDRRVLLEDPLQQRQVFKTVGNPGAIVHLGKIVGVWASKKKGKQMDVKLTLWEKVPRAEQNLRRLAEEYACFRGQKLGEAELSF